MNLNLIRYSCPECHQTLIISEKITEQNRVINGELLCPHCNTVTSVINGYPLFSESEKLSNTTELFIPSTEYADFIYEQTRRPVFDCYSAYYPFNEALQGFMRFVPLIEHCLRPGSLILDLHNRTGWTGELLAALFPKCTVISMWEGNQGSLGYSGHHYWLPENRRANNLEILFKANKKQLPFENGTFDFIFGFDFLHHHNDNETLQELLRVAKAHSPLIFPHVHTNHSEPEPYFERGGILLSASDYTNKITELKEIGDRQGCVISELETYRKEPFQLNTKSDIHHYNCLVAILPNHWINETIEKAQPIEPNHDSYLFINPLFDVDLNSGQTQIDPGKMDNGVRHLLDRHPSIEDDLNTYLEPDLSLELRQILYWAQKGLRLSEIKERLKTSDDDLNKHIKGLTERRIAAAFPVSEAMWELQFYYHHRYPSKAVNHHHFATLWDTLTQHYSERSVLINYDGSEFKVEHTQLFVNACRALFVDRRLGQGDHVLIISNNHIEVLITCWAAWLQGIVVVVINPATACEQIQALIDELQISLAFSDVRLSVNVKEAIVYDDPDHEEASEHHFSTQIEPYFDTNVAVLPKLSKDCPAVILCTSGSTGEPKKVVLTHGSLFRSGASLARNYHWSRGERLLSLGPMHSMSGLRNPAVAALHAGTTIVIASPQEHQIFTNSLRAIDKYTISIVNTVPAFVDSMADLIAQGRDISLPSLRLILSTASKIDTESQKQLTEKLNITIADYYGLTETGGICVFQPPNKKFNKNSIGITDNCIVDIRDEKNQPVNFGESGQLWVYTDNLLSGYYGETKNGLTCQRGWLATGDLAQLGQDNDIILLGRLDKARKNRQGEFVASS